MSYTENTHNALKVDQAARSLAISKRTLRRLIANGEIPAVKVGRSIRILPDDLAEYLRASRIPTDRQAHNDLDPAGTPGRVTKVRDHLHDRF